VEGGRGICGANGVKWEPQDYKARARASNAAQSNAYPGTCIKADPDPWARKGKWGKSTDKGEIKDRRGMDEWDEKGCLSGDEKGWWGRNRGEGEV
jgi:hypothetical protein